MSHRMALVLFTVATLGIGLLITGQNPGSSKETAQRLLSALNKALSGEGNPTLSTVLKVAPAPGLKVSIQPAA